MRSLLLYRGKQSNVGSSELERILMRRRPDASGQLGPIKQHPHHSRSSSTASDELASHLNRRSRAIEEVVNYTVHKTMCDLKYGQ